MDIEFEIREGIKSARAHCGAAINELARQLKRTQFRFMMNPPVMTSIS